MIAIDNDHRVPNLEFIKAHKVATACAKLLKAFREGRVKSLSSLQSLIEFVGSNSATQVAELPSAEPNEFTKSRALL